MVSTAFTIGLITALLANIIVILIYLWVGNRIRKQYLKLKDPQYIKTALEGKTWMGRPITPNSIKRMSIITLILAIILNIGSLYFLFTAGPNQSWAILLACGLILAYATYSWINLKKSQKETAISKSTIRSSSLLYRIVIIIFIIIAVLGEIFQEIVMSSPYFQILIIGLAVLMIIVSEISKQKVKDK